MDIGETIKKIRAQKGLSLEQLGRRANTSATYIWKLEHGERRSITLDMAEKLAAALDESPAIFLSSSRSGNITETPEEILEKLKLAQPISIPVYGKFHAGDVHEESEPVEYIYHAKDRSAGKNIEAYRVYGQCMEPKISNGDIVVVNRNLPGEPGDVLLCLVGNELVVGYLKLESGVLHLQNKEESVRLEDCQASAVVIEVIKRLK